MNIVYYIYFIICSIVVFYSYIVCYKIVKEERKKDRIGAWTKQVEFVVCLISIPIDISQNISYLV